MIQYSKQESEIFGVPFSRLTIDDTFDNWEQLHHEINQSTSKYIKIKVKNLGQPQINQLHKLKHKLTLLEVLRVYKTKNLFEIPFVHEHEDLITVKATESHKEELSKFVIETYNEIPFGNYTPDYLLEIFPIDKQLQCITSYFCDNFIGQYPDKVAYLYYNQEKKLIGTVISEHYNEGNGDAGTFPYYLAVANDERNKGYQFKLSNATKLFVMNYGYPYIIGSTRLSNSYSAWALEKSGFKCLRHDWIYLLEK
ncbi:MAG TPA: hypothetical protein PLJ42_05610 [Chitinophagales bacterium]|jgi:hypothetical protein|nr:hypothetical protein [Chitinophagales bacterium]MBP6153321.1 hypothetical protein [Chitinophagales bacterium]HQV78419.1 hypothetical protein [Chitinophagales bacterium]HQW78895.1 hypothetical protein [Chitinophagales bacterium]